MKIKIENYNKYFTFEEEREDYNIHEMMDILESLLISIGYHPDTVKEGFLDKAEDIEIQKHNENKNF